jgi:hypothetical protein
MGARTASLNELAASAPPRAARARIAAFVGVAGAALLLAERARLIFGTRIAPVYDESIYLLGARGRLNSIPEALVAHRPRGTTAILRALHLAGDGLGFYRMAFAVLGVALAWCVYAIGRSFLGRPIAGWTAAMFGAMWIVVLNSTLLLPDVPAALGVALAFFVYWNFVVRARLPHSLWVVSLALGITFFINPAYAALAGVTFALDYLIMRRESVFSMEIALAVVVLGVFIGGYFVKVWIDHGDPLKLLGISLSSADKLGGAIAHRLGGYSGYMKWFFDSSQLFGLLLGLAVIAGFVAVVAAVVLDTPIPRDDAVPLLLWMVVPTLGMSLLFHAEQRYLLVSLPAIFLGVGVAARALAGARPSGARGLAAGGVLVLALAAFVPQQYGVAHAWVDRFNVRYDYVRRAATTLARQTREPCLVFAVHAPEVALTSPCKVVPYCYPPGEYADRNYCYPLDQIEKLASRTPGSTFFVIETRELTDRQPPDIARWIQVHANRVFTLPRARDKQQISVWRY